MSGWIVIRDWDRFQHYGNRRVPWIKLYTELLYDDGYMSLTPAERSALTGLWMLYAETRRRIPEDTAKVSRALGQRFTKRTLISLSHAGFIEVSSRQPSRPEEEVEKEPPNPQTSSRQKQLPVEGQERPVRSTECTGCGYRIIYSSLVPPCPQCGVSPDANPKNGSQDEYLDRTVVDDLMRRYLDALPK